MPVRVTRAVHGEQSIRVAHCLRALCSIGKLLYGSDRRGAEVLAAAAVVGRRPVRRLSPGGVASVSVVGMASSGIFWPMISPKPSIESGRLPGRRERQRLQMRERLLSAALELFASNGFAETTIDHVAERADVARQTVLNHFPYKADFARAWAQERHELLAAIGEGAAADESARSLVRRYLIALAELSERERDLTRAMFQSLTPNEVFLHIRAVPAAAIERGQAQGEFISTADPAAAAEILTSLYVGTLSRWLIDGPPPFDLAQTLAERLELVLVGLETR